MSFQSITALLFNNPPSPPTSQSCTPTPDNHSSGDSASSHHPNTTHKPHSTHTMDVPSDQVLSNKIFETALQRFAQDHTNSLAKFTITEKLSDKNFMRWSQPVEEDLISMDYISYIKKRNYKDKNLTDGQHNK